MFAYRAEIWCQTCSAGYGEGIPHNDVTALPGLAQNLEGIRHNEGWKIIGGKHFCPECALKMSLASSGTARTGRNDEM